MAAFALLGLGALIVIAGDIYLAFHYIKEFKIPQMIEIIVDAISALLEAGSVFQTLAPAYAAIIDGVSAGLHIVLGGAHALLGIIEGAGIFLNAIEPIVSGFMTLFQTTLGGIPALFLNVADKLFGNSLANLAVAGGHALMAGGAFLYGQYHYQEAMNIGDWCAQYGNGVC